MVELASALAKHPAVYRVDLLTRLIKDPKVAKSYGQEEECILKPESAENDLGGAYIVRLACGPTDQYLRYHHDLAQYRVCSCKQALQCTCYALVANSIDASAVCNAQ